MAEKMVRVNTYFKPLQIKFIKGYAKKHSTKTNEIAEGEVVRAAVDQFIKNYKGKHVFVG